MPEDNLEGAEPGNDQDEDGSEGVKKELEMPKGLNGEGGLHPGPRRDQEQAGLQFELIEHFEHFSRRYEEAGTRAAI